MKNKLLKITMMITGIGILLFSSCKNEDNLKLKQPEFIQTTLVSFAIDAGQEFELFTPDNYEGLTYHWTLPDQLTLISGQGTNRIKVISDEPGVTIPVKNIGVTAERGEIKSYTRWLYREIAILTPPPTLENYKTKRYGAKTWMIENLKEAGETGDLGAVYKNDPAKEELFGRHYTWHEVASGIPNATASSHNYNWGASGIDDAGNPYVLDGTAANSYNIQIQGACPEGWHIANMNDWYDLLVAIKEEYNVPGNTIDQIKQIKEGYFIPWSREEGFRASVTADVWGPVTAYLKGSSPKSEGGLWNGNRTYTLGSWGVFPLFTDLSSEIGFNILPSGRRSSSNGTWNAEGEWSYHFVAYLKEDDKSFRVVNAYNNANFSNGVASVEDRFSCRCVANY